MSRGKSGPRLFKPAKRSPESWQAELTITDLSDDGRGVARRNGKAVFVRDALPGERVLARCQRSARRFDEATITTLISASAARIDPRCEHYATCGGCQLQHLDSQAQRQQKDARFAALIQRLGAEKALTAPILGEPWQYRHRLRLHFASQQGEFRLGFRSAQSHQITRVPHCQVVRPALAQALADLYERAECLHPLNAGEVSIAECGDGQVLAQITLEKAPNASVLKALTEQFPLPLHRVGTARRSLWEGAPEGRYPGQDWFFAPGDFTQANPEINQALLAQVRDWLEPGPGDRILDAFAGLGNFSLALAGSGAELIGLELNDTMVERARRNAEDKQGLTFEAADLFAERIALPPSINKLVLDPPRAGAARLCETLAASPVARIVYVSCDPASFERDARLLLEGGYRLTAACWADMFAQTAHMECIARFDRVE